MLMDHVDLHVSIKYRHENQVLSLEVEAKTSLHNAQLVCYIPMPQRSDAKIGVNAYQTWTESKEYAAKEKQKSLANWTKPFRKKYHLEQYGDAHFQAKNPKVQLRSYSYIYFKVEGQTHLWASIDETKGYTIFETLPSENQLRISKELPTKWKPGKAYTLAIAICIGDYQTAWKQYQQISQQIVQPKIAAGWTSWYNYYTNISPAILQQNIESLAKHGADIQYFQIDDGWQKHVGNWECNQTFDGEWKDVVNNIVDKGFIPGLWFAPFIVEEAAEIPDSWILRNTKNEKVVAGFSPDWSGNFYCLDFSQAAVKTHIQESVQRMLHWGFKFFKVDFLYAINLHIPENKTRGEYMSEALSWLVNLAPEAEWLACGIPLTSASGIVDFCRVSADISPKWEDKLLANIIQYPERVSTLSALRSSLQRAMLDGIYFNNDPDVAILREGTDLSISQRKTLFLINQVVGSLQFISDDIDQYSDEMISLYMSQFPLVDKEIIDIDQDQDLYKIRFTVCSMAYELLANLSAQKRTGLNGFQSLIYRVDTDVGIKVLACDDHLFPGLSLSMTKQGQQIHLKQIDDRFSRASFVVLEMDAAFDVQQIALACINMDRIGNKIVGRFSL